MLNLRGQTCPFARELAAVRIESRSSLEECGEGVAPGVEQCSCIWLGKGLDKSEGRVCGLLV